MIETSLMVNDYPEPVEEDVKCFTFECDCTAKIKISVYAKDLETAMQHCNLTDCDEHEITDVNVGYINDYKVENG